MPHKAIEPCPAPALEAAPVKTEAARGKVIEMDLAARLRASLKKLGVL